MAAQPDYHKPTFNQSSGWLDMNDLPATFDPVQTAHAERAAITIDHMEEMGALDPTKVKDILDFGAGDGGPTWTLTQLAKVNGGSVEAVELDRQRTDKLLADGVLPDDKVHVGNGFEFLATAAQAGRKFDLIVAAMFGPDHEGQDFIQLAQAAQAALRDHGSLLVYSDANTMAAARDNVKWLRMEHRYIPGFDLGNGDYIDDAIVIPKQ